MGKFHFPFYPLSFVFSFLSTSVSSDGGPPNQTLSLTWLLLVVTSIYKLNRIEALSESSLQWFARITLTGLSHYLTKPLTCLLL